MSYTVFPLADPRRYQSRWSAPAHSLDNQWAYGSVYTPGANAYASAVWPSANLIMYVPVVVKQSVMVKKMWFGSGAVGTGNIDIGIYRRTGSRIINSGSVVKTAVNGAQLVDITDTLLRPDLYYLALQSDSSTDTFLRTAPTAPWAAAAGIRTEAAGSFGLPATATWVVPNTLAMVPNIGIMLVTTFV